MRDRVTRFLRIVGLSLAMMAGMSATMGPASAAEKTIRIALQPAPLLGFYVKDTQLLEKRGYKTEWNVFPFSPPILEAMAAGSVDVALLGVGPFLSTAMRNPGVWYFYDELANAAGLVVRADSDIRGPADLKGKKIAFPGKASQLYAQLMMYLGGSGVKESDIDLVRANATDMNVLFQRGAVEGVLAWPPFTSEPVRTGAARTLSTADDLLKQKGGHWLNSGWGVRAEYAKENEDAVLAVVEALHEATRALRQNPQEVYEVFSKATGYSLESVRFMIEEKHSTHFDPEDTAPSVKNMVEIFEILKKYGVVKADKPVEPVMKELVHPEFVEKVLAKTK